MKIFLLGNSQATAAGVSLNESYAALVAQALDKPHEFHVLAMSGWSIGDFRAHLDNVLLVTPDLVVVQVGIIECARRILSEREKRLIGAVPYSLCFTKWLHDNRQAVIRARHRLGIDTRLFSTAQFEHELALVIERLRAACAEVLLLEIPAFGERYEARHYPMINEDVERFNVVLRRHGAVPLFSDGDDLETLYQPGTVHFTALAHRRAAARVLELITNAASIAAL